MDGTRRKRALVIGCLLALRTLPCAGREAATEVEFQVFDVANLGPKTLAATERLVSEILLAGGIHARWSGVAASKLQLLKTDFSPQKSNYCSTLSGPNRLQVAIFARAPSGLTEQTLGFSLPCAESGVQVVLYADQAAKVSENNAPAFSRVLAYAMAHEFGHVWRHSSRHDDNGLMKGVWSKSDWQRAAVSIVPLLPEQTRRINIAAQKRGLLP